MGPTRLKMTSATCDWSCLDLDRLPSKLPSRYRALAEMGPLRGGEDFNPSDWNMHWDQRGDWAIMRGGRRHLDKTHVNALKDEIDKDHSVQDTNALKHNINNKS